MIGPAGTTAPNLLEMHEHSILEFTLWVQMSDQYTGVSPLPFWHRMVDGHETDFCWPGHRVIVECQGATWAQGAHTRGAGYAADRMRANRYQLDGWIVLEFTGDQVDDGTALGVVREALEVRR